MLLTKQQKAELIQQFSERLAKLNLAVLINYRGMKVKELEQLRKGLRGEGVDFKVAKNTLVKIAVQKAGLELPAEIFDKPLAIAFGYQDEVIPAKVIAKFTKDTKLEILGGITNNQFIEPSEIKKLAALPGRAELYVQLVGTIAAPLTRFAGIFRALPGGLVSVLEQYNKIRV